MPYAIVKSDTGEMVQKFADLPPSFDVVVDGSTRRIVSPVAVGDEGLGYRFIEVSETEEERKQAIVDGIDDTALATTSVVKDGLNLQSVTLQSVIDAIKGAKDFAAMQSAIAAIDAPAQMTDEQVKSAIMEKL